MPKKKKPFYLARAVENIEILKKLKDSGDDQFLDWEITIVFYICIHYINCYYCFNGLEPVTSHIRREEDIDYIEDNHHPVKLSKKAYYSYIGLSEMSENARYKLIPVQDKETRINEQKKLLAKAEVFLADVKTFIVGRKCTLD